MSHQDENFTETSLVEEEEEEEEDKEDEEEEEDESQGDESIMAEGTDDETAGDEGDENTIDLPGMPIMMDAPGDEDEDDEADFHGFHDDEIPERSKDRVEDNSDFDLTTPFPPDMDDCPSWYDGVMPAYELKTPAPAKPAKKVEKPKKTEKPPPPPEPEKKVMPLKIKKSAITPPATPSPVVRESRGWKPSAQFFKPLQAGWVREVIYEKKEDGEFVGKPKEIVYHAPVMPGTKAKSFRSIAELNTFLGTSKAALTLHNFSFRNEPMNAPKGQEIRRCVGEVVDIFPAKSQQSVSAKPATPSTPRSSTESKPTTPRSSTESKPKPALTQTPQPEEPKAKPNENATSMSPSLPGGLLKVKMFSKMKERNTIEGGENGEATAKGEDADEDFELDTATTAKNESKTQSLGNSGVTITPISGQANRKRKDLAFASASSPESSAGNKKLKLGSAGSELAQQAAAGKKRPILRPPKLTPNTCSIHCPNATGFPQLSCVSCQSLCHPVCVGLSPPPVDYSGYDFYCAVCQPPAGKENKPYTLGNGGTTITAASAAAASSKLKALPSVTLTPAAGGGGSGKKRANVQNSSGKKAKANLPPLRPIEAQSVVNIAGFKYLVVPHPDPAALKGKKTDKPGLTKLPVLLKPKQASNEELSPTFEVEETPDGKLMLVPMGSNANGPVKNPFPGKKSTPNNAGDVAVTSMPAQATASAIYFAMLHVFRYLNLQDRVAASKVCRFWNQISKHQSLWGTVSLKNCRVHNWRNFRDLLNRSGTLKLDMKKLLLAKNEDETWQEFGNEVMKASTTMESIELPKLTAKSLHTIVDAAANSPVTQVTNIQAASITFGGTEEVGEPVDLSKFAALGSLKNLKLKATSGSMKMANFNDSLQAFVSKRRTSLEKFSLLSLNCLRSSHLPVIGQLSALQHLELGKCSEIGSSVLFEHISRMETLKSVRLERGKVDVSVGLLSSLKNLVQVEMIDFELVAGFGEGFIKLEALEKLLLIPVYKDEVAAINAELVDAMMSLHRLTHFYLGLTTEWLDSISTVLSSNKDSFPILVNGICEMYTLSRLFKTLSTSMPSAHKVKILKMPKSATTKQFLASRK